MASIGNLVVNLSAKTDKFRKGMTGAQSRLKRFGATAKKVMGAGLAVGAGVAAAGIAGMVRQMGELDKTAKLAARSGFSAETIAGMGFAAEQTGSDVASMNKAFDKFSRSMGEASEGTGAASDALGMMGLNIEDLMAMNPDDRLLAVSDAIAGLEDPSLKASAAADLFGRSGVELVNVLGMGSEGIKAFQAEADKLGLGFDAAELAKVEEANDAINRIKRSIGGAFAQLAIKFSPMIASISEGILEWTGAANTATSGVSSVFDTVTSFIAEKWKWLQDGIATGITASMAVGEWAMTNWQQIAKLVFVENKLAAVAFGNQLVYIFGTVIPTSVACFADNFQSILFTAVVYTLTLFINVGKNIRAVWQAVLDFFSTGTFDPDFTPLLEGARSVIASMPDIPERIVGEVEAALAADAAALQSSLATSFDDVVGERMRALAQMQAMESATAPEPPTMPELPTVPELRGGDAADAADAAADAAKPAEFAGAIQKGSAEAFALAVRASTGKDSPVKEQKKTNGILRGMAKVMERQQDRKLKLAEQGAV